VLRELSPEFARLYLKAGRPSIPPEKLLRALLLQLLYSIRSERQLIEQLDWMTRSGPHRLPKNRERLLRGDIARAFFERVLAQAQARQLLSPEHFTVDGTLIEAWASLKSVKLKAARPAGPPDDPGNPTVNFHGERRSNATHASYRSSSGCRKEQSNAEPQNFSILPRWAASTSPVSRDRNAGPPFGDSAIRRIHRLQPRSEEDP
jgi:Transposase domain (DUF772)